MSIAALVDGQGYRIDTRGYRHDDDHGFCAICGSVWPCSRADLTQPRLKVPVPRDSVPRVHAPAA